MNVLSNDTEIADFLCRIRGSMWFMSEMSKINKMAMEVNHYCQPLIDIIWRNKGFKCIRNAFWHSMYIAIRCTLAT